MRTMELSDLHIFRCVVEEGGISKAALKLHRVQSNVTTRIRQLEQELGVALFLREGKRLLLTASGRILLDYAERLLALADEARGALADGAPRGHLRLGSMISTAAARLPDRLSAFHRQHPEVQLELRTAGTGRLVAEVLDGTLDCALVSGPVEDVRLENTAIFYEKLVVVAPAGHPPIGSAQDLQTRTLLTFESDCAYYQRLESWLSADRVVAERIVELASYHAIIGCAASGMGIALAPQSLLDKLNVGDTVSLHALPEALAQVTTVLIRRREKISGAVAALLRILGAGSGESA
ncbi:MAG TPA: LysR substrate-binding domain-containing protein [Paucimonas sp.]|nr:LysR substrate-binding domain-containing protein [Paucimonas sp.]HJW57194.1 LysR substrate-binding domain-containing protein [Burkholderiaceae bacterium]